MKTNKVPATMLSIAIIMLALTTASYAEQSVSILERVEIEKQSYIQRQQEIKEDYTTKTKRDADEYASEKEGELTEKEGVMEGKMEYRMNALENTARATAMRYLPVVLMLAFVIWLLSYMFEQLSSWTAVSVKMMSFAIAGFIVIYFAFPAAIMLIDRIGGTN